MPARRPSRRQSKSHRRRPRTSRAALEHSAGAIRQPPAATPAEEKLWSTLRQGARNVAGVRYQLAVTALLLAESRSRVLPFVELVPEGYEDIDCFDGESTRWLVQVKEFGAGAGTFTASSMAEVISHAAAAPLTPAQIVAITDGRLGANLAETGWNHAVSETPGYDTQSTVAALTQRGYSNAAANTILMRTHLITYPWNTVPLLTRLHRAHVRRETRRRHSHRGPPRRLSWGRSQPINAARPASSVGRFRLADLDALVQKTLTIVDVHALDSAVRLGVCDIADYTGQPSTDQSLFLQGIDAIPAHIGSGFRRAPSHTVPRRATRNRNGTLRPNCRPFRSRQINAGVAIRPRRRDRCAGDSRPSRRDGP